MIQGINTTTQRELVGSNDAGIDGQQTAGNPPADRVAQEVNLLAGLILCPEADTAKQEGPLEWLRCVRVAASQLVVMPEHRSLELEPLSQEGQGLHLAFGLFTSLVVNRERRDVLDIPHIGARGNLLVSVDFLLLVAPFRERGGVRPHSNLARVMDELEVTGDTLEFLALLTTFDADFEQGILKPVTVCIRDGDRGELLIGGVVWRGDVMRQEHGIGDDVAKTDKIMVLNMVSQLLVVLDRNDLPVVIGIIVGISCNLLTLARNTAVIVS